MSVINIDNTSFTEWVHNLFEHDEFSPTCPESKIIDYFRRRSDGSDFITIGASGNVVLRYDWISQCIKFGHHDLLEWCLENDLLYRQFSDDSTTTWFLVHGTTINPNTKPATQLLYHKLLA